MTPLRRTPATATRGCPGAPGQRIERRADQHHGRQHGQRGQQRLPVEERRDQQEARQADEQRAVANGAGLQELDGDQDVQEGDRRVAARQVSVRRAHGERRGDGEQHERPRRNARRRRLRPLPVPRSNRRRTTTSSTPVIATQMGRCGACGSWADSSSAPSHPICAGVSGVRPAAGSGAAGRRTGAWKCSRAGPSANSASAVSALRRWSRPCCGGRYTPGTASANGRALRSAAITHAVRRDSRASGAELRRQRRPVEASPARRRRRRRIPC